MQDVNESLETLLNVYNYADILVEGAFHAIECPLAQMNIFSHYCLTFSTNDCIFSLNEIQKVYVAKQGWLNEDRRKEPDQSIEDRSSGNRVNCNP